MSDFDLSAIILVSCETKAFSKSSDSCGHTGRQTISEIEQLIKDEQL